MIGFLNGKVIEIAGLLVLLDVQGVGYEVLASQALVVRCEVGQQVSFYVYTDVQEHAIRLFGFDDRAEKQVFLLLNRVNGLGPKSALDIISHVDKRDLLRSIGRGDVVSLTRVRGIGKKKAERIVVELKDLVGALSFDQPSRLADAMIVENDTAFAGNADSRDAISALEVLGFSRREAESAVEQALKHGGHLLGKSDAIVDTGALVREALKFV